ncbi:MAG: 50S ribosomal protein L18 [Planctomycetota bacterium]|jgi:large subunit ribosomal protein L18
MKHEKRVEKRRIRRQRRVRRKIHGTAEKPRLSVYKSNKNFSCQALDDDDGHTLFAATTNSKAFREMHGYGGNIVAAAKLGTLVASGLKSVGITRVKFDRGHYRYHGRIKAFAEKLREGEIQV